MPFKTAYEWQQFKLHAPSGIHLVHCADPYAENGAPATAVATPHYAECTSATVSTPNVYGRTGHGHFRQTDVVADDVANRLVMDQPRHPAESPLDFTGLLRPDVDVVVGVVAQQMPVAEELLEPVDVFLFEDLADHEPMGDTAFRPDATAGLDDIVFGR